MQALDKLALPRGFVGWAWATGRAQQILDGKKDVVEALREWRKEVKLHNG